MTPTTTHGTPPGGISDGGADALWYARAAIKSAADLDDQTVFTACATIMTSKDERVTHIERERALHLLCLVEGEMA